MAPMEEYGGLRERCRRAAEEVFSKFGGRFEVKRVGAWGEKCVVDFVDAEFEPLMERTCEEYCDVYEEPEEYEECVRECEEGVEAARTSSVVFDPDTLVVEHATVAVPCPWWGARTEEEGRRRAERFAERFRRQGCYVNPESVEHLHGHEIAGVGELEEEAAVCYAHPTHLDEVKCRLDALLRAL